MAYAHTLTAPTSGFFADYRHRASSKVTEKTYNTLPPYLSRGYPRLKPKSTSSATHHPGNPADASDPVLVTYSAYPSRT